MNKFIEVPAGKRSFSQRKLVYGIGINDADYVVEQRVGGKRTVCPSYRKWVDMLTRCYSAKYHEKHTTYSGCSVTEEWLTFSNFKRWMDRQEWEGMQLDKDLLVEGNKIYNPKHCLFIPSKLNTLLTDSSAIRGEWPIGVSFNKKAGKFRASCSVDGKDKHLGLFSTPTLASAAYKEFKSILIADVAGQYKSNCKLYTALMKASSMKVCAP